MQKPNAPKKFSPLNNPSLFLEHIMAGIIFIAIIIAIIGLWEPFLDFVAHREENGSFLHFAGTVFSVVIGIEFFKLLCTPGKDTLLEVLMFVVARHMIIEETSPMENLISIITIALLFVIDFFLLSRLSHSEKKKDGADDTASSSNSPD